MSKLNQSNTMTLCWKRLTPQIFCYTNFYVNQVTKVILTFQIDPNKVYFKMRIFWKCKNT